jgi:hypothetical protein
LTNSLPSVYQSVIHKSRYARFLEEENRREEWEETVDRLVDYMIEKISRLDIPEEEKKKMLEVLG